MTAHASPPAEIELLAPARDLLTARAALRAGADAIYLGGPDFGARSAAGNSLDDVAQLCREAHVFGAKVYVTLNTLLLDEAELQAAEDLAWACADRGVDALIIQDVRLLQRRLPASLALHASTQMDNRTPQQAALLAEAGLSQIVVARELSLSEIRAIHDAVPAVPLEAFVHGALCVSLSGRCYASEFCFNRSANRGRCAQFCRLRFQLVDARTGDVLAPSRHYLSLRDMNRVAFLEEMMDAGVRSFKIEGRLKGADYVANVVAFYRQALDAILSRRPLDFRRSSAGASAWQFTPDPERSFSRGFTPYFIDGQRSEMLSPFTPKSIGARVGQVQRVLSPRVFEISAPQADLHAGDGLCFFAQTPEGPALTGFRVNRVDGIRIHLAADLAQPLPVGTWLHRNEDYQFTRQLEREDCAVRRLAASIDFTATPDGFRLTLTDELSRRTSVDFPAEHIAAKSPSDDAMRRALSKTGDTPLHIAEVRLHGTSALFLPASTLNAMRREAVEQHLARIYNMECDATHCAMRPPISDALLARLRQSTSQDAPRLPQALMTCRFCLRHALRQCLKEHAAASDARPWALRLPDGRTFPLRFDCRACLMQVLQPEPH